MKIYSQNNEQLVIQSYFEDFVDPEWIRGCFLDIGSNDGVTLSNTHSLALSGWKGVCVEPSPAAYTKLAGNYFTNDDIICFKNAVSDYNGKAKFYESDTHLNKGDISLLSSLSENEIQKWKPTTKFREIEVDVINVPTLLLQSPFKEFQFISIDAEGEDWTILQQLNLDELECECLCIEWNGNLDLLDSIKGYCYHYGLRKELTRNAENVILAL